MHNHRGLFGRIALFTLLLALLLPAGNLSAQEVGVQQASPVATEAAPDKPILHAPTATSDASATIAPSATATSELSGSPEASTTPTGEPDFSASAIESIEFNPPLRAVPPAGSSSVSITVNASDADSGSFSISVTSGLTIDSLSSLCATWDAASRQVTGTFAVGSGGCLLTIAYSVPNDATAGTQYDFDVTAMVDGGDEPRTSQASVVVVTTTGDTGVALNVTPEIVGPGTSVMVQAMINGSTITGKGKIVTLQVTVPEGWTVDTGTMQSRCEGACANATIDPAVLSNSVVLTGMTTASSFATNGTLIVQFGATIPDDAQPGDSWVFDAGGVWNGASAAVAEATVTYPIGTAEIILTTADGLPLPAGTKVCLDTTNCQVLDEETPSGTVLTFPGLPLREHPITITAPGFPDATGTITIEADQTVTTSIQLSQLSGTVEITLVTSDGNPIPASTTLCLADRCDTVDNLVAADSASGSIAIFNDVLRGTYPITVTNATPYLDASGEIAVPAATTAATTITLLLPDVTVTPTMGATATTEATAEATSTESTGEVFPKTPTVKPTASATASIGITNPVTPATGSGTVSTLPSTGAGSSNTAWLWPMCALAASFLLLAATTRRRHRG